MLARIAFALAFAVLPEIAMAERPVVVELFTSESCSSCPPADRFLTDLARSRGDVLPLAFHVTYWNDLGWQDPFSFDDATARQRRYGAAFGDGVYTPEMVVDGAQGLVGSDRDEGMAAIERARQHRRTAAAITISRDGGGLAITVGPGSGNAQVLLIGFDREHRTAVGRGENGGETLLESNIVRSMRAIGQWSGAALRISAQLPAGEDIAVLLQAPEGPIIGAARLGG